MRDEFLEHVVARELLPVENRAELLESLRLPPELIGSIAFKHGMISPTDIDRILDEQRKDHRPFGEIAMSLGLLSSHQVDILLKVQEMQAAATIAEQLALSEVCPTELIINELGHFLIQHTALCTQA